MSRSARVAAALFVCALTAACEGSPAAPLVPDPPVGLAKPVEPGGFVGTPAPGVVALVWTDVAGESFYRVQRARAPLSGAIGTFSTVVKTSANATSHDDYGMQPLTRYLYRLRACNADGCSPAADIYVVSDVQGPPPPPATLFGTMNRAGNVILRWSNVANEDEYRLYRALAPEGDPVGPDELLASPSPATHTFIDVNPPHGERVRYRVRACNEEGCSAYSSAYFYVRHVEPPAMPTGLTADGSSGDVVLNWNDVDTETDYQVVTQVAPIGGGLAAGTDDPPLIPGNTTTYTDTQVLAGTRYLYQVRACNEAGCSEYRVVFVTVAGASASPPTPANFAGDGTPAPSVVLTWNDGANETEYRIRRVMVLEDESTAFPESFNLGANVVTYTDENVGRGRRYQYSIRACRPEACSAWARTYVDTP